MGHSTKPDGSRSFNYLCETKEKSRQKNCAMKNAPGNLLDEMVCNEIKKLAEDDSVFMRQWKETKKALLAKGDTHKAELKSLKNSLSEKEKQINNLLYLLLKVLILLLILIYKNELIRFTQKKYNLRKTSKNYQKSQKISLSCWTRN